MNIKATKGRLFVWVVGVAGEARHPHLIFYGLFVTVLKLW